MKKLTSFMLVLVLVFGATGTALASSDGLGFTQTLGYSYATLNVGPFKGDLSIAQIPGEQEYQPHTRLGLSIPACCGGIYTGGMVRFDFVDYSMEYDSMDLFAGYEFDIDPVVLKFDVGPKFTNDTIFYDTSTWEWELRATLLFNPFNILNTYECEDGDPCDTGDGT